MPGVLTRDPDAVRACAALARLRARSRSEREVALLLESLRQGLTAEVEPLCADELAADLPPGQRATVLATVAMARHATGQSGREALDEALTLGPGAELVGEAVARLGTPPPARVKPRRR